MEAAKDFLIRVFMAINAFLIRASGGRIGTRLGAQTILILHTIGRKSGLPREIPIAYFAFEGKYMIVASNWGKDKDADWVLNLRKYPHATIDVNGKNISVQTYEAEGDEYDRLWKFATSRHPPYLNYQKMTSRRIPIIVLHPLS